MRLMLLGLALVPALCGTAGAQAHRPGAGAPARVPANPQPIGFMLNAHTVAAFGTSAGDATQLDDNPLTTGLGPGGGVQVGYAFNRTVMVFASADIAKQNSTRRDLPGNLGLTHIDVGARVNVLVHSSRLLPYAMASVEHRSLGTTVTDDDTGLDTDVSFSGFSLGVGGGVQYFMSPKLALDAGVGVGFGKLGTLKVDGQHEQTPPLDNSTTARLLFGVNWYP
jgi:opacity protein-like surface antigen